MGLEELLYGSKIIRDYLKLFSEQQWNRVSKATIMLGIEYLNKVTHNDLRQLSIQKIEDIVVDLSIQEGLPGGKDKKSKKDKKDKKRKDKDDKHKLKSKHLQNTQKSLADSSINVGTLNQSSSASLPLESSLYMSEHQRNAPKFKKEKPQDIAQSQNQSNKPIASKPPSTWRNGSTQRPEGQQRGRQQQSQTQEIDIFHAKPRAASLNPLIYPSWWGQDDDFDQEIRRDRSNDAVKRNARQQKVENKRENPRQQQEDTLERKLREAQENKKKLQSSNQNKTRNNKIQQSSNLDLSYRRNDNAPNYAYTSNKNVPKYSPIRNPVPGANNIPMSYAGPPTQAEINRNLGRNHHTNAYDTNYRNQPKGSFQNKNTGGSFKNENTGGMSRGGGGGIILSYSPPRERQERNNGVLQNKQNHAAKQKQKAKQPTHIPIPARTLRPQTYEYDNPQQLRHSNSNNASKSKLQYDHIPSKVKDQIEYHKRKFKQQQQQQENNREHSKDKIDTKVYVKGSRPQYFDHPRAMHEDSQGAALRRRNSPLKELADNEYRQSKQHPPTQGTQDSWPLRQQRSSHHQNQQLGRHDNYIPHTQQQQPSKKQNKPPSDQTDQFSMRNTQGQWPSSIENLNMSNNRSTGQGFYGGPNQNPNRFGRNQQLEYTNSGVEKNEITQGMISSPIKSHYTESSPERQTIGFGNTGIQNGVTEPSMIGGPQNLTRYGGYPPNGNESGDHLIFRSDGFEQSRYGNNPSGINPADQSRYSRHPFVQQQNNPNQQTPYHYNPNKTQGDVNSSTFSGGGGFTNRMQDQSTYYHNRNNNTQNPFAKNQQPNQSFLSNYPRQQNELPYKRQEQSEIHDNPNHQARQNEWVGNYQMSDQLKKERDLKQLAESNSYTYTLQNPISNQPSDRAPRNQDNPSKRGKNMIHSIDEDADQESEISNYSQAEEFKNIKNQPYIPDQQSERFINPPVQDYQYQNRNVEPYVPQRQGQISQYNNPNVQMLQSEDISGRYNNRQGRQIQPPPYQNQFDGRQNHQVDDITDSDYSDNQDEEKDDSEDFSDDDDEEKSSYKDGSQTSNDDQYSQSSYQESRSRLQTQTAASNFYQGKGRDDTRQFGGYQDNSRRQDHPSATQQYSNNQNYMQNRTHHY
ncbi:UNKNOWN [Stylonychia lemnae]|uniref:Uncharacterized protein n=1 Tax=Stylonychia lemnae TaxID=5949 RepID=A0A078AE99_STYLE|nr:UNKNOWN [Stylonychia lemnae]|eukprot:CDW80525.1 UNKNOWN [Stylonychia lemnae]